MNFDEIKFCAVCFHADGQMEKKYRTVSLYIK